MQPDRSPPLYARLNNALRRLLDRGPVDQNDVRLLERHGLIERRPKGLALSEAGRVRLRAMPLIVTRRRDDPVEAVLSKYAAGIERLRPSEKKPDVSPVEPDEQPAPIVWYSLTDTRRWIALARSRIERTREMLRTHRDLDSTILSTSRGCIEVSRASLSASVGISETAAADS